MVMSAPPAMRERLLIQVSSAAAAAVSSLTRTSTTATVTMAAPHGYVTKDYVTIAGATPTAYNGRQQITVTSDTAFTFTISGTPPTPATGTITATYASDAQGGRRAQWRTVDSVNAEHVSAGTVARVASTGLQLAAVQATVLWCFRTRRRADIVAPMRALWTPNWPGSTRKTLEITGVAVDDQNPMFMFLNCAEVQG